MGKIKKTEGIEQFLIEGAVELENRKGDLPFLKLRYGESFCTVYCMGAHVASFSPDGKTDLLWMSPYSSYQQGVPLRGGIPICFPWFGPHRENPSFPMHGFVRTLDWNLITSRVIKGKGTQIVLSVEDNEKTYDFWPYHFRLELTITVNKFLTLHLLVKNKDHIPFTFEEAFHTYFSVSHSDNCIVKGLSGINYIDRLQADTRKAWNGDLPIRGPMVHAYMYPPQKCELIDQETNQRIQVFQKNMNATVVWNPGKEMGETNPEIRESWKEFVCIESANCLDCKISLKAGEVYSSMMKLRRK